MQYPDQSDQPRYYFVTATFLWTEPGDANNRRVRNNGLNCLVMTRPETRPDWGIVSLIRPDRIPAHASCCNVFFLEITRERWEELGDGGGLRRTRTVPMVEENGDVSGNLYIVPL
jgi:hypothetical protein